MATNSKREQIIVANKTLVESISSISTVTRTLQDYSDLQEYASTQFPVCAVVGRLPKFDEKLSRRTCVVDKVKAELKIDFYVYIHANVNPDTQVSTIADDLFAKLYTDQTRGNLVTKTLVKLEENLNYWSPFVAFKGTVIHEYYHDTTGI